MGLTDDRRLIKANQARRAIRKMLLGPGGTASVDIRDETRMVSHSPQLGRPPVKLPWPLSRLQPRDFQFWIYKNDGNNRREVVHRYFDKTDLDEVIEQFLSGIAPTEEIHISVEGRIGFMMEDGGFTGEY